MSQSDDHNGGIASESAYLRSHADLLAAAGALDGWFVAADVPDHGIGEGIIKRTKDTRLLVCEWCDGTIIPEDEQQKNARLRYRLSDDAREYLQAFIDERDAALPCGHSGLQNLGGDRFGCGYEGCDREFERSEVDL